MADGDPILVFCYESDIWIGDFSLAHLAGPVIYLDPPFAALRAAQLPLIFQVNAFRLLRLKTLPHPVEHVLWRRIGRLIRRSQDAAQADRHSQTNDS